MSVVARIKLSSGDLRRGGNHPTYKMIPFAAGQSTGSM
jgi:hypothetical protein